MGELRIESIRQKVRIGCTEQERSWPQLLKISLTLSFDHERCIETDALEDTIDYMGILAVIDDTSASHEWRLIETYADDLCYALLERFALVGKISIAVTKTVTPVADGVTFLMEKER